MILGVGLDVCDIRRLRRALARPGFKTRVFEDDEVRYCERQAKGDLHYGARFAAKEALFKAIGTGWSGGVGWREVAVERDGRGRPTLRVAGAAAARLKSMGVRRTHLSLSHAGEYAAAVVVLEGGRRKRPAAGGRT